MPIITKVILDIPQLRRKQDPRAGRQSFTKVLLNDHETPLPLGK